MKSALVLATALLVQSAWAQPAPPAPMPTTPPAPSPQPLPADPNSPPPTDPASDPAPAPPPKPDPAYGERPDTSVNDPAASDMPGIRRGRDIVVRYTPSRSAKNITTLAIIGGSALLLGGIGLYYHFDSRSASDSVEAIKFSGEPWTAAHQADYDRAHSSATLATAMYGIGGALLVTTAIIYMVTEPKQIETVISPHSNAKHALVAPTRGGALVGTWWSF